MTIRNAYEYVLVECNKVKAPQLLLEDFIYIFNKAIQQYINLVYNRCELNQQSTDDLSFLQTTTTIDTNNIIPRQELNDVIWDIKNIPNDYLHMLNCVAEFTYTGSSINKCPANKPKTIVSNCSRLTADLYAGIINNYYMKPSPKKPYYYIINKNSNENNNHLPNNSTVIPTDYQKDSEIENGGSYFNNDKDKISEYRINTLLKAPYNRTANQSTINIEIHSGDINWKLNKIYLTYLKAPMYVYMSYKDNNELEDTTQVLEFPDYVCYEIINIAVRLILENSSDPRLQTNIPINQSILVTGNK